MSILILKRLVNRYNYYYNCVGCYSDNDKERKIIEICKYNANYISERNLASIIGKEPDYPCHKVGSITLKKVFMKSFYELQHNPLSNEVKKREYTKPDFYYEEN